MPSPTLPQQDDAPSHIETGDWIRRLNMIERVRRILILVRASAHGRCNEGGIDDEDRELLMAIGGAADEGLEAIKADIAAQVEAERPEAIAERQDD